MSEKPDYRLNLPRTEFPMQANLTRREPERLARWEASRLYARIQEARSGRPRFVLHDGPPFANGDVHVGTALNKSLKDFIVKYETLRGRQAPYVPGWDCHGLPIESKVTQDLRAAGRADADAAAIREECRAYAMKHVERQKVQFKRLGVLGDWENPYLTLSPSYEAAELRLFADIVDQGLVFRGKKPVYWSIPYKTALAEAEVEYKDHVSPSVYVKFRLAGEPNTWVLIWTTTPWTLPANLAVAFSPTLHYSLVHGGDGAYLIADSLRPMLAQKLGWESSQIVRSVSADELASLEYEHPFCPRTGRLFPADFVDGSTGTGFVHIAPGHGQDDYNLGLSVGLPVYCPVDDDGRLRHTTDLPADKQFPAALAGLSTLDKHGKSEANEAVLALLSETGALAGRENYTHSYPHCWRSKTPIIFRAVDQWFIGVDRPGRDGRPLRAQALASLDQVEWTPGWGRNRIQGALESRPDWCISRQRSWGVPIPAFYAADREPILSAEIVRRAADLVEREGSNAWFSKPVAELWAACRPEGWTGPEAVARGVDTLDVWIDSGSSSRAVLMARPELQHAGTEATPWRADVYLEGSDQHRGWFQSSLWLSLAGNGAPPFKAVITHGFMVDEDREKISKSKQGAGGYEKPQTAERYVNEYGADVLRLWVASQDYRNDIVVSEGRLKTVAESYRLLRNTLRYQLGNLFDFDPTRDAVPDAALTSVDRWFLGAFSRLEAEVARAYEAREFHVVYQRVAQFAAVELSSLYHDVIKDRLYTEAPGSAKRRSTQTVLWRMARSLSLMLSPVLVFTADEAWEFLPGRDADSAHLAEWAPSNFVATDAEHLLWPILLGLRERALPELEKARQARKIGKSLEAVLKFTLSELEVSAVSGALEELREVCNVSAVEVAVGEASVAVVLASELGRQKCERCWRHETGVGSDPLRPLVCPRCAAALATFAAV
jgi:isoleucyl-tRNA synthetase